LIEAARNGDADAFRELVEPYRRELQLHCYRVLGSLHDAEDAVQETLLAAWQGLGNFEARASIRTWLYRIHKPLPEPTTRAEPPSEVASSPGAADLLEPTGVGEVVWLEPYPDAFLDGVPDTAPGPDVLYETREAISLAFMTAVQRLPPRQRAVHILRDVLGYRANEVAQILDSSEESVTSALKRAGPLCSGGYLPNTASRRPRRPLLSANLSSASPAPSSRATWTVSSVCLRRTCCSICRHFRSNGRAARAPSGSWQ
jgi:RNA polymerase sigma-70 factor (TIGR02960 family)